MMWKSGFVILGTSHSIQWKPKDASPGELQLMNGLESAIRELVAARGIALIAEEGPGNFSLTVARQVALESRVNHLQVDLNSDDPEWAWIRREMETRDHADAYLQQYGADELRFPHADDIRENVWLDRIQKTALEPVLVVCGWAHARALSKKVKERCGEAPAVVFFPDEAAHATIIELYLVDQGAVQAYPYCRL